MVQGLPGMQTYRGPFDVINKVVRSEGLRGLYRGFGITLLTQSPASALWWSSYGGAQHAIWRSLGYGNGTQKKPSHTELVAVQATAGTIAGACSSIITTPIDTIKTRLQVSNGQLREWKAIRHENYEAAPARRWLERFIPRVWTTLS
uniref:Solute carrier family 25 member 44 n=1 Tax=Aegilops tauschii subsp. strangulata TaxID=200361 RepID=A0A453AZQ1_AEGTS